MSGETASVSHLEASTKHRIGYYQVLDVICIEMEERANGFSEINEIVGFLKRTF